jgi:protein-S-isoprenylcysteine O-methyltransferase Ste14
MNSRFLNALPACSLAAYTLRISVEEKILGQSLGEEYRQYAERTKG